jgi:hypothetical protein
LEEAQFEMKAVERKKDMVITTWLPPEVMRKIVAKVLVATKDKHLYSVTMIDKNGSVMSRQILKNYKLIQGVEIPSEILIATYLKEGRTIYQVINMENITLNEQKNDEKYNFNL